MRMFFRSASACLLITTRVLTAEESSEPNIVFILADDLGYGDVPCLNPDRGKIKTPHRDSLASQGMVFTDAHSPSSVCTPTRCGMQTGAVAGEVLEALKRSGADQNTLVIMTSDTPIKVKKPPKKKKKK